MTRAVRMEDGPKFRYGEGMAGRRKYTDTEIVAALQRTRGLVFHAAGIVGCHADTIYERAKTSTSIARAMRTERGKMVDVAESKLFTALDDGEAWAVQFALRTLGKDRGYWEKQEVNSTNRTTLEIVEEIVAVDTDPATETADPS